MVKNILILGGSGNCGSHLNKYFIKNYKVTSTYFADNYKKEKITIK